MEFIASAFPFRHDANSRFVRTRFMLAGAFEEFTPESDFNARPSGWMTRKSIAPKVLRKCVRH